EQLKTIEGIIETDIRPGLNMDGGDLRIQDLEDGQRLLIKWQGACGGCASSTGATLAYIEDSLRRQVFSGMQVIPVEDQRRMENMGDSTGKTPSLPAETGSDPPPASGGDGYKYGFTTQV